MRLVRYGDVGKEKPGILDAQGGIRDVSGAVKDIDGTALSPEGLAKMRGLNVESLPKVSINACVSALRPCVRTAPSLSPRPQANISQSAAWSCLPASIPSSSARFSASMRRPSRSGQAL